MTETEARARAVVVDAWLRGPMHRRVQVRTLWPELGEALADLAGRDPDEPAGPPPAPDKSDPITLSVATYDALCDDSDTLRRVLAALTQGGATQAERMNDVLSAMLGYVVAQAQRPS